MELFEGQLSRLRWHGSVGRVVEQCAQVEFRKLVLRISQELWVLSLEDAQRVRASDFPDPRDVEVSAAAVHGTVEEHVMKDSVSEFLVREHQIDCEVDGWLACEEEVVCEDT